MRKQHDRSWELCMVWFLIKSLRYWRWNTGIDTRISKTNTSLRELYHSVVRKTELSETAKLLVFKSVIVPILTHG